MCVNIINIEILRFQERWQSPPLSAQPSTHRSLLLQIWKLHPNPPHATKVYEQWTLKTSHLPAHVFKKKNCFFNCVIGLAHWMRLIPEKRKCDSASPFQLEDSMRADEHFCECGTHFSPSSALRRSSSGRTSLGILTCGSFKPSVATEESVCCKHFLS